MEEKLILKYLDKHYDLHSLTTVTFDGVDIVNYKVLPELVNILGFDIDVTTEIFDGWLINKQNLIYPELMYYIGKMEVILTNYSWNIKDVNGNVLTEKEFCDNCVSMVKDAPRDLNTVIRRWINDKQIEYNEKFFG